MNISTSLEGSSYFGIFIFLAAVAVALFLFLAWRRILGRFRTPQSEAFVAFLIRIGLPAIFLLVALALKFRFLQRALALSEKHDSYLDAAIAFFALFFLIRLADSALFYRYQKRRLPLPLPRVLHGFVLTVVYLVLLLAVLNGLLGVNITPLLAGSAILTAILGFAFQGVLGNVLAGISLNLTKCFSRGDWVKIGPHEGVVLEINWRETLLVDRASNVVVIPNNAVASEMIVNFARPDKSTALTLPIKVSYEAPPSLVYEVLREAAREVPGVLSAPAPQAYILSYDDFGISYIVKFWVTEFARKQTITGDVARHVWYKFKRKNIEISITLAERVKEVVEAMRVEEKARTETEEGEKTYADLLRSDFFRYSEGEKAGELVVPEEEILQLASSVRRLRYTKGEVLFRQGEKGETCYLVSRGMIKGEVIYEELGKRYTTEFNVGPGGVFGEMSLFTGLPRTATGVILEDAELLEIGAEDFGRLLSQNPKVAETIAEMVSGRNQKNLEFLRKIKELSEKDIELSCNKNSILERLKRLVSFFKK